MDWKQLLFSLDGRVNRAKYWLVSIATVAAMIVAAAIGFALFPNELGWVLFGAVTLVCVAIGVAVSVKRLHDRDKSGWWLLLYYLVPGMLGGVAQDSYEGSYLILNLIGHAVSLWALIDLGFLRGTAGDNRYGADPLAKV